MINSHFSPYWVQCILTYNNLFVTILTDKEVGRMKCLHCGIEFEPVRSNAKFCSDNCRVTHNRRVTLTRENVTLSNPDVTLTPEFRFTVKIGPHDKERGLIEKKNKVRTAKYWYDVPLAAVPVLEKGWPKMPEYMDGRQYFLWWKNNFKMQDDKDKPGYGHPLIHNPFPHQEKLTYLQAGDNSRRWGA